MKLKISMVSSLAVLFLLVILSGCVAPESTSTITPIQTETPISTATELSLKIGETAKTSEIEVTVVSINKTDRYTTKYNTTVKADAGEIFYIADVEIKNIGSKGIIGRYSYALFTMTDSLGFEYLLDSNFLSLVNDTIRELRLYPNSTLGGKFLFEVPEEAKGLKIKFDFSLFSTPDYKPLSIKVKSASWRLE